MKILQKVLALYLASWILFAPAAINATQTDQSTGQSAPRVVKQTPEELQQLVAPIALYPDALVLRYSPGQPIPPKLLKQIAGYRPIRTSKGRIWRMPSINNFGIRASKRSPSSPPCSPTWTRILPGPLRSERPM